MNKLGKTAGRFPPGPAGGWGGGPGPGGQPPPQPPQREPRIPGGRSSPVRPKRVQKQNPLNTGGPSAASRLPSKPSSGERARLAASGRAAGRVGELGEVRPPLAVHALHAVVCGHARGGSEPGHQRDPSARQARLLAPRGPPAAAATPQRQPSRGPLDGRPPAEGSAEGWCARAPGGAEGKARPSPWSGGVMVIICAVNSSSKYLVSVSDVT